MNAKTCLAALIVVVATIANVQGQKLCQPSCGPWNSNKHTRISTCCQQYETRIGANFDACCASSCANGNPCN
eukprot:jgi/Phyca11/102642/e_gw1.7.667.1